VGPLLTSEAVIPLLAEALEAPTNCGTTPLKPEALEAPKNSGTTPHK
jgi:hypothetical protein